MARLLLSAAAKGCEAIDGQEEARAAYGLHRAYTLADVVLSEPVVSSDDIIAEVRKRRPQGCMTGGPCLMPVPVLVL